MECTDFGNDSSKPRVSVTHEYGTGNVTAEDAKKKDTPTTRAVRGHLGRRRRRCVSVLVDLPNYRGLAPQLPSHGAGSGPPSGPFNNHHVAIMWRMWRA